MNHVHSISIGYTEKFSSVLKINNKLIHARYIYFIIATAISINRVFILE